MDAENKGPVEVPASGQTALAREILAALLGPMALVTSALEKTTRDAVSAFAEQFSTAIDLDELGAAINRSTHEALRAWASEQQKMAATIEEALRPFVEQSRIAGAVTAAQLSSQLGSLSPTPAAPGNAATSAEGQMPITDAGGPT